MSICRRICALVLCFWAAVPAFAQQDPLSFATVERPPFASQSTAGPTGFSLELLNEIAARLGRDVDYQFYPSFEEMFQSVKDGQHNGAVANISITAERETVFDFTQPIFESGVGVLLLDEETGSVVVSALFKREILLSVLIALALLFGSGMLMWLFERNKQPYFDRPVGKAFFPSFWWALNLVVNGGFEERQPQSALGRIFSVILVVASLFIVSVFVATITSALTVAALQENVDSINDLEGRKVATVRGSTSAALLDSRELAYSGYPSPAEIFAALEAGMVEAVVFDAPILAFYETNQQGVETRLLPRIYRRENYGIALASGSDLAEQFDLALLRLREDGTYDALVQKWFGRATD